MTEAGNYNFGFIDHTEFTGNITFVNVNFTTGFWLFTSDGFSMGNPNGPATMPHRAIVDTGTSFMVMQPAIVQAYYGQVKSAKNDTTIGGYVFSCQEQLPDFILHIGAHKAIVPGDFIKYAPIDTDSVATAKLCVGGIQSIGNLRINIYGDVFIKSQFVVFDGGKKQLGFASKPLERVIHRESPAPQTSGKHPV
jgi:hypothetical protein